MRTVFYYLKQVLVVVGLGTILVMFTNASWVDPVKLKSIFSSGPPESSEDSSILTTPSEMGGQKRFIQIENKMYEYNPENTYLVDGVKTYYVESNQVIESPSPSESEEAHVRLRKNTKILMANPLKVYSPQGMEKMAEIMEQSQKNSAQKQKLLEEITK